MGPLGRASPTKSKDGMAKRMEEGLGFRDPKP